MAEQRPADVCGRDQIAARANGPIARVDRSDTTVQEIDESLDDFDTYAGKSLGECVRSQQHRGPYRILRQGRADAAGEKPEEVFLVKGKVFFRDQEPDVAAESGVDAVDDFSPAELFFEQRAARQESFSDIRIGSELDGTFTSRNGGNLLERQAVSEKFDFRKSRLHQSHYSIRGVARNGFFRGITSLPAGLPTVKVRTKPTRREFVGAWHALPTAPIR